MSAGRFNEMEIDAIGEIMNISLGSSATALSTMLGTKVNITTPVVKVQNRTEFEYQKLEPAIGVEISYVKGLDGRNLMMFSRNDVRIIVSMMMGMDIPEEEFVMDEMNASAIREVMNQMMGSSATALSEFLGTTVDISTPVSFEVPEEEEFKDKYFPGDDEQVVVCFTLEIEDKQLESEFLNIMSVPLVKKLLTPFAEQFGIELSEDGGDDNPDGLAAQAAEEAQASPVPAASSGGQLDQSAVDAMLHGGDSSPAPAASSGGQLDQSAVDALLHGGDSAPAPAAPAPQPAPAPAPQPVPAAAAPAPQPVPAPAPIPQPQAAPAAMAPAPQYVQGVAASPDPMTLQLLNQMQQSQTQMMQLIKDIEEDRKNARKEPRQGVKVQSLNSPEYADTGDSNGEQEENREMLMKVPLEISVEIGRTKKLVKDILEFTQGSLVVLDKMAGEQADLYVNGECIARGDIVVVEDNFGIRITEIVNKDINPESL